MIIEILWFVTWPVLVFAAWLAVRFVLDRFEKGEGR